MKHEAPGGGSLRLRLLLGSLVWVVLAIAVAGWGLRALFVEHITRQFQDHLLSELDHLSAVVNWSPEHGVLVHAAASDPRLSLPLSGLYWQIDQLGQPGQADHAGQAGHVPRLAVARSRSLWDQVLPAIPVVARAAGQGDQVLHLQDGRGRLLLAVVRTLQLPDAGAPPLRLVMAGDEDLLAEPLGRFSRMLALALGVLTLGLIAGVAVQLQLSLRPLRRLRQSLVAVHEGHAAELSGNFPQELQPLVAEFNHVLAQNTEMVERARTQAGNLAHALRTPLTLLANAAAPEEGALAQLVREQTGVAGRQVDYHLARARAAVAVRATGLRTPVLEPLHQLLTTMRHLHAGRHVDFELAAGAQPLAFRGEAPDLYELLGNLLDNAGKWAHTRVVADVQLLTVMAAEVLCITVDDDGPGIPAAQRARMFERGVQLDEQRPGVGLGLDIVRTLAETYGGGVAVQASPLGGARFCLYLPVSAG